MNFDKLIKSIHIKQYQSGCPSNDGLSIKSSKGDTFNFPS